uniref:EGF-like domain-containing protein n=1 Tax=Panagrellus redivivus TaxID=6233 RepID=A0A7E4VRC8_PANRE
MKLALLLLLYATSATAFSFFQADGDKDNQCFNDGYTNVTDNSCICKDLIGGDKCSDWKCINYGVPTSVDDELRTCACPRGFIGTHCEPVACVEGFIQNEAAIGHSFSLVIVLNDHMKSLALQSDNITQGILNIFDPSPSNLDLVNLRLLGGSDTFSDTVDKRTTPNLTSGVNDVIDFYNQIYCIPPYNATLLTFNDIYQSVIKAYSHSSVLIVTDIGLQDFTNLTAYQEILLAAVARQIEINVVVVSSMTFAYDVYFDPSYTPLRNLADATLGSFISPYPALGPAFENTGSEVITAVGKLLLGKTVVATADFTNTAFLNFNARKEVDFDTTIYISVYAYDVAARNANISLTNLMPGNGELFNIVVDAGPWKLYSSPLSETKTTCLTVLKTNLTAGSYKIWVTANNPPRVSLGFATDDIADAHSPLPVAAVQSAIVAHIDNLNLSSSVSSTIKIGDTSSISSSESRNCLFELKLGTITCPKLGDIGTVVVTSDAQSFQETLAIACSTNELNQKPQILSTDTRKLSKKGLSTRDSNATSCNLNSDAVKLDPTAPRTFAFVLSKTGNLAGQLQNSPYNSIIMALRKYFSSYSSFYGSYLLLTFCGSEKVFQNNSDVNTFIVNLAKVFVDANLKECASVDQRTVLETVIDNVTPFSEVFYVTDKELNLNDSDLPDIYNNANAKRVKLTFLPYSNLTYNLNTTIYSQFYDLAIRTSGNVVPFTNITTVTDFFNAYHGQENAQIVTTKLDKNTIVANIATPSFLYNSTNRYVVSGTAETGLSNIPPSIVIIGENGYLKQIDISGNVVGTKYFSVDLPPLEDGYYTVKLIVLSMLNGTYFNVRQMWDSNTTPDYSVIAFTTDRDKDATTATPSFYNNEYLYLVAKATTNGSISIYSADGKLIKEDKTERRELCSYEYILPNYQWLCTEPNGIYYIKYETEDYTHTTTFNCISSGSDFSCQNGGTKNETTCNCPVGFEGDTCGNIVCFNDGTHQDDNTCLCNEYYEGKHCETSKVSCSLQPSKLHYTSAFETLILVIDTTSPDLVENLKRNVTNLPQHFRRYILATPALSDSDKSPVKIFDSFNNFKLAISQLVGFAPSILTDIKPPLKDALSAVTTDRPLLVWLCNNGPLTLFNDIDEIQYLVAKTRAEVRSFTMKSTDAYLSIATLGNGIPNVVSSAGNFSEIPAYISTITPKIDSAQPSKSLVSFDYYLSENCGDAPVISVPFGDAYITLFNYQVKNPTEDTQIAPNVYKFTSTLELNVTTPVPSQCGYMIEYLSSPRIAYTFTSSKNYETNGFLVPLSDDVSILNFALEDVDIGSGDFQFPIASTSTIQSFGEFKYELAPVLKKNCTYPLGVEIQCNKVGPLKVKIQTSSYTQTLTAYCSNHAICGVNGTKLDNGGCACDPGWSGSDCKTPSCLNGGTAYATVCVCNEGFYGANCEYSVSNTVSERNIFILLDVVELELLPLRKQLATEFVSKYGDSANYTFATNTANQTGAAGLIDYKDVLKRINSSQSSNDTINLDSSLNFFNKITVSNTSLTFIFYITNSKPPVDQSLETVNTLKGKGIFIFSAYFSGNDSVDYPTVYENAVLGGVTAGSSTDAIISRFQNALQGGATTEPSISTTAGPYVPCVKYGTYDILVLINSDIGSDVSETNIKDLLHSFGNDVHFDTSDEKSSRVTLGVIGSSMNPNVFCATSKGKYGGAIDQTSFTQTTNTVLTFGPTLDKLDDYFNKAKGVSSWRAVPRVLITISKDANISDIANLTRLIEAYHNEPMFLSLTVGIGEGNFTELKSLSNEANDAFVQFNSSTVVENVARAVYTPLCDFYNNQSDLSTTYHCSFPRKYY